MRQCCLPALRNPALYEQLIPIITPVVVCALAGYLWARAGWTFDREFVTRMIMNIGAPALVLDGIGGLDAETPQFLLSLGLAFLVLLICASVGLVVLRATGQPVRSYLLPVTFGNVGNLVDAVLGDDANRSPGTLGLTAMRIIEAASESAHHGQSVVIEA